MTNVTFEPNAGLLIDDEHQIKIEIIFNQSITVNNAIQNEFIETPISLYSDEENSLFLKWIRCSLTILHYSSLISSIQIGYVNANNSIQYVYQLTEEQLNAIQLNQLNLNDVSIDAYQREDVIYDPSLLASLRQLNWYYVSHFSVYIILVFTLGYLIFLKPKKLKQ